MKWFKEWYFHPAVWYEFWWPQSGALGGVIFAFIIVCAGAVLIRLLIRCLGN